MKELHTLLRQPPVVRDPQPARYHTTKTPSGHPADRSFIPGDFWEGDIVQVSLTPDIF